MVSNDCNAHREDTVGVHTENFTICVHRSLTEIEHKEDHETAENRVRISCNYNLYEALLVCKVSAVGIVVIELVGHQLLLLFGSILQEAHILVPNTPR